LPLDQFRGYTVWMSVVMIVGLVRMRNRSWPTVSTVPEFLLKIGG
jgi:hypothetical protein